jgi:hypothetical protein
MVILAVDFDGTIVKDEYPGIGKALPGAIQAINELYDDGYCIIINSCRAREREDEITAMPTRTASVVWFRIARTAVRYRPTASLMTRA